MAPCDARAPCKPLELSPALQLPWERCSLPLFSLKVPLYVGCPKKYSSKLLVQESEHLWSHRDRSLSEIPVLQTHTGYDLLQTSR